MEEKTNLFLILCLVTGILLGTLLQPPIKIYETSTAVSKIAASHSSSLKIAAVDEDGNGVLADLIVETKPGDGAVLVNIDKLLFWMDTQYSIRTAKEAALQYLNLTENWFDIIYTIKANSTLVGGPSAGAALAIATIYAAQNKSMNKKTLITGTISSDGTIGPVGGILQKAQAAKEAGYKNFLVPNGQKTQLYYEKHQSCTKTGLMTICRTKYNPTEIDVGKEVGINIIEVSNISEAVKYFS